METTSNPPGHVVTPEGGWGYVVTASMVIMNYVSLLPQIMFPLLYGSHLGSLGDETSSTALALQIFVGVMAFTGCFSGFLISKCGYRITALIGACSYCCGSFGEHFGTSLAHIVVFTSVFKGMGYGLMQMSSITVLNAYFYKKLNLAMGVSQALIAIGTIAGPPLTTFLMKNVGIKNTIWLFTGLALLNFPAMATYRPVKQAPMATQTNNIGDAITQKEIVSSKTDLHVRVPLLHVDGKSGPEESTRFWSTTKVWMLDDFGMRLFNQLKFWNITVGLAAAYTADVLFYSFIRVILNSLHYDPEDISLAMMAFFVADVVGRICYAIMSAFWTFKNRSVFLVASIVINFCRIMFFFRNDYMWKLTIISLIGWLRAFIETSLPLVISEDYRSIFPKAYSMYHILLGIINLISSPLTSFIKTYIGNDAMVVYIYAGINYLCCLTWLIEMSHGNIRKWFCKPKADLHEQIGVQ